MRSARIALAAATLGLASTVKPAQGQSVECLIHSLATGPYCAGDCDRDGTVGIVEVIRGVRIALARAPLSECAAVDADADGRVTVAELVQGVTAASAGCPLPAPIFDDRIRLHVSRGPNAGDPLRLSLSTETIYGCLGNRIDTALRVQDGSIVAVLGCVLPPLGPCLTALGPAGYSVDLDLDPGSYELELRASGATDRYSIDVTEREAETEVIEASFSTLF